MISRTDLRKPLRSRTQQLPSGKFVRKLKTKPSKQKPIWDDSVNDLKVFKPSSQELKRNHELHLPKRDHERLLRKIATAKALTGEEEGNADDSSFFFGKTKDSAFAAVKRKEILRKQQFYNQEREITEMLSETDKTIAEAQDIFGDTIYKYKSIPTFTKAPNLKSGPAANCNFSTFLPSTVTHYDTLSESIVRELNPVESDEENYGSDANTEGHHDDGNDHDTYSTDSFKSKVNVDHYHNVLSQSFDEENIPTIDIPDIQSLSNELTESIKDGAVKTCAKEVTQNNYTITSKLSQPKSSAKQNNIASSALQTFDDMKKMLDVLEGEIEEYEQETGKDVTSRPKIPSSISGYTSHLIYIIIRLTNHLKQSEVQLKAEMAMRSEILDMFDDQRQLVDVLTNNLMELEEQNDALKKELVELKSSYQENNCKLTKDVDNLKNLFNQVFLKVNNEKLNDKKPLEDVTNIHGMSWVED